MTNKSPPNIKVAVLIILISVAFWVMSLCETSHGNDEPSPGKPSCLWGTVDVAEQQGPAKIDIGKCFQGELFIGSIRLVNSSGKAVNLISIRPDCSCTTSKNFHGELAADASKQIGVQILRSECGEVNIRAVAQVDDRSIDLNFVGEMVPRLRLSERLATFDDKGFSVIHLELSDKTMVAKNVSFSTADSELKVTNRINSTDSIELTLWRDIPPILAPESRILPVYDERRLSLLTIETQYQGIARTKNPSEYDLLEQTIQIAETSCQIQSVRKFSGRDTSSHRHEGKRQLLFHFAVEKLENETMRHKTNIATFLFVLLSVMPVCGQVFGCYTTDGTRSPCFDSGTGYSCSGSLAETQTAFMNCLNHDFKISGSGYDDVVPKIVNAVPPGQGQDIIGMNEHVCWRVGDCVVRLGNDGRMRCYNDLANAGNQSSFSGVLGGPTWAEIQANQWDG